MIRLNDVILGIRENPVRSSGYGQDFTRVLVIAQLDDDTLYTASEVARTAWNPDSDRDEYARQPKALGAWVKQDGKNIAASPENVYPGTRDKIKGQAARWLGSTWKSYLCDFLWNRAARVFDERRRLMQADEAEGITGVVYWWS